jgi:hypothetical protein
VLFQCVAVHYIVRLTLTYYLPAELGQMTFQRGYMYEHATDSIPKLCRTHQYTA